MTQEDKQLLLRDLCMRLPYGVKVCARFNTGNRYMANVTAVSADRDYVQIRQNDLHPYTGSSIEDVRPYLRPMSSMTEEERKEYISLLEMCQCGDVCEYEVVDWFNAHHFDYRVDPSTDKTLIESGLALEAPEDMYKNE